MTQPIANSLTKFLLLTWEQTEKYALFFENKKKQILETITRFEKESSSIGDILRMLDKRDCTDPERAELLQILAANNILRERERADLNEIIRKAYSMIQRIQNDCQKDIDSLYSERMNRAMLLAQATDPGIDWGRSMVAIRLCWQSTYCHLMKQYLDRATLPNVTVEHSADHKSNK